MEKARDLQRVGDLLLDFSRQRHEITGPHVTATDTHQRHHGVALNEQRGAVMVALGALNR